MIVNTIDILYEFIFFMVKTKEIGNALIPYLIFEKDIKTRLRR